MKKPKQKSRLAPQQSDIIIRPDGEIVVSFLWDDLRELTQHTFSSNTITPSQTTSTTRKALNENIQWQAYEHCQLCPKKCGANRLRHRHPRCGGQSMEISSYGISFGDEECIRGEKGSGVIMLAGCPLTCISCHNPEMVAKGYTVSAEDFLNICFELQEAGAENIQILSPTVHLPQITAVLRALKAENFPLPIVFKSSGYESVEELKKINGLVDVYLPDLKFASCSSWAKKAGAQNYWEIAQKTLSEMYQQVGPQRFDERGVLVQGLLIRHVAAPLPSSEKNEIFHFLQNLPLEIGVSIQNHFSQIE